MKKFMIYHCGVFEDMMDEENFKDYLKDVLATGYDGAKEIVEEVSVDGVCTLNTEDGDMWMFKIKEVN